MPLKDVALSVKATPEHLAGLLCDALAKGTPFVYADNEDPAMRTALCGALPRVGTDRGLDVVAQPFPPRVLVYLRPGSRKEARHAA